MERYMWTRNEGTYHANKIWTTGKDDFSSMYTFLSFGYYFQKYLQNNSENVLWCGKQFKLFVCDKI